jgi:hypothetical protein
MNTIFYVAILLAGFAGLELLHARPAKPARRTAT